MSKRNNKVRNSSRNQGRKETRDYTKSTNNCVMLDKVNTNDPRYYNKIKELFDPAIRKVSWPERMGNDVRYKELFPETTKGALPSVNDESLPGIAVVEFMNGPGWCSNTNDAVNTAFTNLMAVLYAKTNSANLNFQQADLAIMLTSLASIIEGIAEAKRTLMSTDFWIHKNLNYPRGVISSMGYKYEDIIANKANHISRLNSIIRQFNNLRALKFLDTYDRSYGLGYNIFVDEDSAYGQIYYFKSRGFYLYKDTESKAAFTKWDRTTFGTFLYQLQEALNAWQQSSDYYLMSGALQRAFPNAPYYAISEIQLNDMVTPVADKYHLMQIQNMCINPIDAIDDSQFDITQDPVKNLIKWEPKIGSKDPSLSKFKSYPTTVLLRHFNESSNITDDDNVEMTRWITFPQEAQVEGQFYLRDVGPEFCTGIELWNYSRVQGKAIQLGVLHSNFINMNSPTSESIASSEGTALQHALQLSNFRFIPTIYANIYNYVTIVGDMYNYTYLNRSDWYNLQTACMFSLYDASTENLNKVAK